MTTIRFTRREVLALGATAAAVPLFSPAAQARDHFARATVAAGPLSVGYLSGSENRESLRVLPWEEPPNEPGAAAGSSAPDVRPRIVPAGRLPLGDQSLAGEESVRLRVHGIYPSVNWAGDGLVTAALFVRYPEPDPHTGPIRVLLWELRRLPAYSPSPPLTVTVPLGVNGELELGVEVQRLGDATALERWATFTVDSGSGIPKLKRGVYFLGVDANTWGAAVAVPHNRESTRQDLRSVVVSVDPIRTGA